MAYYFCSYNYKKLVFVSYDSSFFRKYFKIIFTVIFYLYKYRTIQGIMTHDGIQQAFISQSTEYSQMCAAQSIVYLSESATFWTSSIIS